MCLLRRNENRESHATRSAENENPSTEGDEKWAVKYGHTVFCIRNENSRSRRAEKRSVLTELHSHDGDGDMRAYEWGPYCDDSRGTLPITESNSNSTKCGRNVRPLCSKASGTFVSRSSALIRGEYRFTCPFFTQPFFSSRRDETAKHSILITFQRMMRQWQNEKRKSEAREKRKEN